MLMSKAGKGLTPLAGLPFRCASGRQMLPVPVIEAVQGLGSLFAKIDGDYNNMVGFPVASFVKLLELLVDEDPDFLEVKGYNV